MGAAPRRRKPCLLCPGVTGPCAGKSSCADAGSSVTSRHRRRWGYLSRAGLNDKSQLCRQIEKASPWPQLRCAAHAACAARALLPACAWRPPLPTARLAVEPLLAASQYADIYTSRVSNFLRYTPYM